MSITSWVGAFCMLALCQGTAGAAFAAPAGSVQDNWLMMVTTENTDPKQEAQFNDWYDRIDIPDVLRVPGYERARRGVEQRNSMFGPAQSTTDPTKYVALYDIRSPAIDKTIIDMLMASWGMEKSHHSTDLLKVTERVYFHQYTRAHAVPIVKSSKANKYLYMVRFDCCHDSAAARDFNAWYERKYVPAVLASEGFTRTTRYKLYRVLMDRPVTIPEFLGVFELTADSLSQALQEVKAAEKKFGDADRANLSVVEETRSLFLQINDVNRP
jgi:hypothetical protein